MKGKNIVALISLIFFFAGCKSFTSANGSRHWQALPAKDKLSVSLMDTSRFIRLPFDLSEYSNKVAYKGKKRIVENIEGEDIQAMAITQRRYYLYFWNPTCGGTRKDIHKLDSLSKTGENVVIISLRSNYEVIDNILSKTSFAKYPCYVIEAKKYSTVLLTRKIRFIKDACAKCYEQYKDDLAVTDYVLVENGTITPVMYNEQDKNVLIH